MNYIIEVPLVYFKGKKINIILVIINKLIKIIKFFIILVIVNIFKLIKLFRNTLKLIFKAP